MLTKFHVVKAMVFPVAMYGCESWAIKKAEHWRIDAFELWCWRRCLRVPWTARRSSQSLLKEISPEYSLKVLMLKVKFQYLGHLIHGQMTHWKRPRCWDRLKAGGERNNRGWMRWLDGITDSMDMSLSNLQEIAWRAIHGVAMSQTGLSDWTTTIMLLIWETSVSQNYIGESLLKSGSHLYKCAFWKV